MHIDINLTPDTYSIQINAGSNTLTEVYEWTKRLTANQEALELLAALEAIWDRAEEA
jgi:hypothetical protein